MSEPTNCKDCEHGWCTLVLETPAGPVKKGIECPRAGELAWKGDIWPQAITPPDWCPLRKEASTA